MDKRAIVIFGAATVAAVVALSVSYARRPVPEQTAADVLAYDEIPDAVPEPPRVYVTETLAENPLVAINESIAKLPPPENERWEQGPSSRERGQIVLFRFHEAPSATDCEDATSRWGARLRGILAPSEIAAASLVLDESKLFNNRYPRESQWTETRVGPFAVSGRYSRMAQAVRMEIRLVWIDANAPLAQLSRVRKQEAETARVALLDESVYAHPDRIPALIAAGASVTAVTDNHETPLERAAMGSNWLTIKALLDAGSDINHQSNFGRTALMNAAGWNEDAATTQYLIQRGANVNIATEGGRTALYLAEHQNGNPKVSQLLRDAGAR